MPLGHVLRNIRCLIISELLVTGLGVVLIVGFGTNWMIASRCETPERVQQASQILLWIMVGTGTALAGVLAVWMIGVCCCNSRGSKTCCKGRRPPYFPTGSPLRPTVDNGAGAASNGAGEDGDGDDTACRVLPDEHIEEQRQHSHQDDAGDIDHHPTFHFGVDDVASWTTDRSPSARHPAQEPDPAFGLGLGGTSLTSASLGYGSIGSTSS